MAGKRGLVYGCKEEGCDWMGEKSQSVRHFTKQHANIETAPYSCSLCMFLAASSIELTKHRDGSKHQKLEKKSENSKDCLNYHKSEDKIMNRFFSLDSEQSKEFWSGKTKDKTPVKETDWSTMTKEQLIEKLVKAVAGEKTMPADSTPKETMPEPKEDQISMETGDTEIERAVQSITSIKDQPERTVIIRSRSHSKESTKSSSSSSRSSSSSSSSSDSVISRKVVKRIRSLSPDKNTSKKAKGTSQDRPRSRSTSQDRSDEKVYTDWKRKENETFDVIEEGLNKPDPSENGNNVLSTLRDIKETLQTSFHDRPSLVAAAVTGITRQLINNNKGLVEVNQKLDRVAEHMLEREKKEASRSNQTSSTRAELRSIHQSICVHQNTSVDLSKAVKELAVAVKTQTPRMEAMLQAVTTSLDTFAAAVMSLVKQGETQPKTINLPSSIDTNRLTSEFNNEWSRGQVNQDRSTHRNRRPEFCVPSAPRRSYNSLYRRSVDRSVSHLRNASVSRGDKR